MRYYSGFAGECTEDVAFTNHNLVFRQLEPARMETWTGALNVRPRKLRESFRVEATKKLPSSGGADVVIRIRLLGP